MVQAPLARASASTGRRRRVGRIALGLLLAWFVYFFLTLPPRARASVASPDAATLAAPVALRGAYHIHTTTSDGTGTVDDVAAAAARAGLQFIIITDHGDGTRTPLPPAYRSGVLCIDAVEISTTGGHYVALGLPGAAPYRLAGEPRDVVEDVRRLGGFGIAAHPDSPKPELRWEGWDTRFDGIEWLNEDTEWRDESYPSLLRAVLDYAVRPAETLGALAGHSRGVLDRWDRLAAQRRVVGLVAVDAHARVGLGKSREPYAGPVLLRLPSYEASFRSFTVHVELPTAASGDATRDAQSVLQAMRAGHVYATLDALAQPGPVGFIASTGGGANARTARMGDFLVPDPDGVVTWDAAAVAPEGATMRLLCDGRVVTEVPATARLHYQQQRSANTAALPASCRVEAGWELSGRRVTWLATNSIYLRAADPDPPVAVIAPAQQTWRVAAGRGQWLVEHDPQTQATAGLATLVDPAGPVTELRYTLRAGDRASQYAALVTHDVDAIAQATRVSFAAWADRPMRVSVQVRVPRGTEGEGERWQRSVYLDQQKRTITVTFDDMTRVPPAAAAHPPLASVRSLLFVVDTVNTQPGTAGRLSIGEVRLEK